MSEHQWGDAKEGVRACQRGGCGLLLDTVLGAWKLDGELGWGIIKRGHPVPPCASERKDVSARCTHVDRIGVIAKVSCQRPALPRLVVCEHHATPDAVRMIILAMAAEIQGLKSSG